MTDYHRPCPPDPSLHDRSGFRCRATAYADWLRRYSGQNRKATTAATWVIADRAHRVVAYAGLSMTAIDVSRAPQALRKAAPDPIPALLIGRLAVDERHERLGLGTELVKHILATAVELNQAAAFKAVVVAALSDAARTWWRDRLGFVPFDADDPGNFDLYLVTSTIAATPEHTFSTRRLAASIHLGHVVSSRGPSREVKTPPVSNGSPTMTHLSRPGPQTWCGRTSGQR